MIVDGNVLPEKFSNFVLAFDYLFKVHFVLNLKYDVNLETFFKFIQVYFYKVEVDSVTFTPKMHELRARLSV